MEDARIAAEANDEVRQRLRLEETRRVRRQQRQEESLQRELSKRRSECQMDILWFSSLDFIFCVLMIAPLGAIAVAGFMSPVAGLLSARLCRWQVATVHVLLEVMNFGLRAIYVPLTTTNFLFASGAIALALSSAHLGFKGIVWTRLLWRDSIQLRRRGSRRRGSRERVGETELSAATPATSAILTTSATVTEGLPVSVQF